MEPTRYCGKIIRSVAERIDTKRVCTFALFTLRDRVR